MSTAELANLSVREFAQRFRQDMVPLSNVFSYFPALPLSEEDIRDYLEEPIAAVPPALQTALVKVCVFLVPYLERGVGKAPEVVTFSRPDPRSEVEAAHFLDDGAAVLVVAVKDRQAAEYHHAFYRAMASLLAEHVSHSAFGDFYDTLRDELRSGIHGEIDEEGWNLKQALVRKQSDARRDTKLFRSYARQSLIDTLTLYLHGICCDIDVETGPRQLPSRFLRRRLQIFHDAFPPPQGYAVFPEELNGA